MEHNLKTLWNKVIESSYDRPERKNMLLNELKALERELQNLKPPSIFGDSWKAPTHINSYKKGFEDCKKLVLGLEK